MFSPYIYLLILHCFNYTIFNVLIFMYVYFSKLNFIIKLANSIKKLAGILMRIVLILEVNIVNIGRTDIFIMLSHPSQREGCLFI